MMALVVLFCAMPYEPRACVYWTASAVIISENDVSITACVNGMLMINQAAKRKARWLIDHKIYVRAFCASLLKA